MDLTTQSVLCCIGPAVVGCPTHFVMQRLFHAYELDWQVLTVEVEQEEFETAIHGMQAMHFSGVRLLGAYEKAAIPAMQLSDSAHQFLGAVTSASFTSDGWQAWHSTGFGILEVAKRELDWSNCICLLVGDSITTRSFMVALAKAPGCATVLWADAADEGEVADEGEMAKLDAHGRELLPEYASLKGLTHWEDEPWSIVEEQNFEAPLLVVGDLAATLAEGLQDLARDHSGLIWAMGGESHMPDGLSEFQRDSFRILSPMDILAAAEAYDFKRWTDEEVEESQVRDAYEEFTEFL